jgi:hypothetical protein
MSEHPRRRQSDSLPGLFWALMGFLLVALFVLALALLHPPV